MRQWCTTVPFGLNRDRLCDCGSHAEAGSGLMVQIQLLGGVAATTDQGTPVELGATKARVVLAALALSAGQPVAVTRLIDLGWAENPPRTAEKTLQGATARKGVESGEGYSGRSRRS